MRMSCDRCSQTYTDKESIDMALAQKKSWEELVRKDGEEPRGICPCPILPCPGELILR